MSKNVDQELLCSFATEANSYLPEIVRGVADFHNDPRQIESLEKAYRHSRTIKGASSMVGLSVLSDAAADLEEILDNIAAGWIVLDEDALARISDAVVQIGDFLQRTANGIPDPEHSLDEVVQSLRYLLASSDRNRATVEEPRSTNGYAPIIDGIVDEPTAVRPSIEPNIPADLLEIFLPEAEEYLRTISLSLPSLADQPENRELLQNIRRSAHSLKGSAGTIGFHEMSQLAHRMEDLLDLLYDGEQHLTSETLSLLFASTDALDDMINGQIEPQTLHSIYNTYSELLGFHQPEVSQPMKYSTQPLGNEISGASIFVASRPVSGEAKTSQPYMTDLLQKRGQFVRVPIEQLDEVVKLVAELIITRASFEQNLSEYAHQLEDFKSSAVRLGRVSDKMGIQYEASTLGGGLVMRTAFAQGDGVTEANPAASVLNFSTHGFDDLEFDRYTEFHLLLRGLTEAANDIQTLVRELDLIKDNFNSCLTRQGRLSSEIQDKLMHLRMVPLSTLSSRLHRTVRTVASQRGKSVRFILDGEETKLDKTVIDEMADPLLHILRNAIDHGIELPLVREAKGKPATGTIRLKAFSEGTQIIIQISDDGVGLDPERLKSTAISAGYISSADAMKLSEEDIFSMIFLPDFSTAPEVSEISGRGVGLDVVRVTVNRLKGSVRVDSKPGNGTVFTIRLPMTLAVMRALMVKTNNETYAIPLVGISHIVKVNDQNIERVGQDPIVRSGNTVYPMLELSKMLNLKPAPGKTNGQRPVLLMNLDGRPVAIAVDETLGGREIVVKNLGNHLRQVRGVTGATLMGNGNVVLILNLAELIRDSLRQRIQPTIPPARVAVATRRALTAMVVDDSLSVRRVLSNLLTAAGWKPIQAKDGLDALETMPHLPVPPDIILLDIEMPRMDGYEFISALRKQKAYESLPIVVLTSRAGQKHREKAFEVGATEYLVKPYQDEVLLGLIRRLVQSSRMGG